MAEEKKVYSRTKGILPDTVSGFCPGCMHSTVHKLIGEAAEELGLLDRLLEVGWGGLTAGETGRIGGMIARRKRELSCNPYQMTVRRVLFTGHA